LSDVDARRHGAIAGNRFVAVQTVLFLDFMAGGGDHHIRAGQDLFFRFDALIDLEFFVDVRYGFMPSPMSLASLARPSEWPV
jgi:hypothetical protein